MCVVSMVGDHWGSKYPTAPDYWLTPQIPTGVPTWPPLGGGHNLPDIARRIGNNQTVTRDEFDALKRDMEELKALLKKAIKYDADTKQAGCENKDKFAKLREIANLVGVDLDEVFEEMNKKKE